MKFFNLLKKELSELLTLQTVASIIMVMVLFLVLGNVMSDSMEKAVQNEYTISISDRDNTDFTSALKEQLRASGVKLTEYSTNGDDYSAILNDIGEESLIIIPEGFTESLKNHEAPQLISISAMESSAMLSNITNDTSGAIGLINSCISSSIASELGISSEQYALMNDPVTLSEHTVIGEKSAEISSSQVMNNIMMKNMILPIIIFVLIIMTSQMLMNSIANEKIDKTLETLLSAPVSRTAVLGAKMLAAAIVAMLNAVCYMVGMSAMMKNATGEITEQFNTLPAAEFMPVDEALEKLGLALGAGDYVLIGIQLFLTIIICLSLSLMLGAMVNDTKQAQTFVMPLMFMAMIPYMISMFADINKLPMLIRIVIYAIPFTHTFSAISNLSFGHTGIFFGGLAYQAVIFVICMVCALKLFRSDLILTANLNFGQRSKFRKANKSKGE